VIVISAAGGRSGGSAIMSAVMAKIGGRLESNFQLCRDGRCSDRGGNGIEEATGGREAGLAEVSYGTTETKKVACCIKLSRNSV
jgi:hypothetical protein